MEQDLIAELRQLLKQVITPDLEALMAKLEALQQQMMQSERNILDSLAAFRAESAASHAELLAKLEALRDQIDSEQMGERPAPAKPNRFLM